MTASLVRPAPRPAREASTVDMSGNASAATPGTAGVAGKMFHGVLNVVTAVVMLAAVAAFLFLAVGPRVLGYQISTMLTGSMSPLINPGDVVVTVPVPVTDLKVGDIITYHIPVQDQRVETHRITTLNVNNQGTATVQTKGDANNGADPWTATIAPGSVDREVFTVPYLGNAIRALRDPILVRTLMYGAPAVLVVMLLTTILRKKPQNNRDPVTNDATVSEDATAQQPQQAETPAAA